MFVHKTGYGLLTPLALPRKTTPVCPDTHAVVDAVVVLPPAVVAVECVIVRVTLTPSSILCLIALPVFGALGVFPFLSDFVGRTNLVLLCVLLHGRGVFLRLLPFLPDELKLPVAHPASLAVAFVHRKRAIGQIGD